MKPWVFLFLAFSTVGICHDWDRSTDCANRIIINARTQARLRLEAKGEVRLRGLIIEMKGQTRLALTTYLYGPGHALLFDRLLQEFPKDAIPTRIWGGELLFRDGVLVRGNATSGYLFQSGDESDPDLLARYLASSGNRLHFAESLEIDPYDPKRRHLDDGLNAVILRSKKADTDSALHEINNNRYALSNFLSALKRRTAQQPPETFLEDEIIANTLRSLPFTNYQAIDIYLRLLNEDGIPVDRRTFITFANKVIQKQPITVGDVREMNRLNEILNKLTLSTLDYSEFVTVW